MTLPPVVSLKKEKTVCCKIDRRLLSIKAYYFLHGGGTSAVSPFVSLVAKSIGFSVAFIGVINTITVVFALVAKPLVGGFTDKFGRHKAVWLFCYVLMTAGTFSIIFIPHLPNLALSRGIHSTLHCGNFGAEIRLCNVSNVNGIGQKLQRGTVSHCNSRCLTPQPEPQYCHHHPDDCLWSLRVTADGDIEEAVLETNSLNVNHRHNISLTTVLDWRMARAIPNRCIAMSVVNMRTVTCNHYIELQCSLACDGDALDSLSMGKHVPSKSNYLSYQLWWFSSAIVVSGIAKRVVEVIQTALVYGILGTRYHLFGKQRMFGSLGNGIVFVVSGILNQLYSGPLDHHDYSYGFYIYAAFLSISLIVISLFKTEVEPKAKDIAASVSGVIARPDIAFFFIAVFFAGICNSFSNTFGFWFLTDLNVSPLLLGLSRGVQCFAAEIPCLYFSGWIIKKTGHEFIVSFALLCYGVAFITASCMQNVYLVFFTEMVQGVGFGLFHPAVTSFVSLISPPGMKTVMQGILFAVFKGAGRIVGNLAGGLVYASLGGRVTFRIVGSGAVACAFVYAFVVIILKKHYTKKISITEPSSANLP